MAEDTFTNTAAKVTTQAAPYTAISAAIPSVPAIAPTTLTKEPEVTAMTLLGHYEIGDIGLVLAPIQAVATTQVLRGVLATFRPKKNGMEASRPFPFRIAMGESPLLQTSQKGLQGLDETGLTEHGQEDARTHLVPFFT